MSDEDEQLNDFSGIEGAPTDMAAVERLDKKKRPDLSQETHDRLTEKAKAAENSGGQNNTAASADNAPEAAHPEETDEERKKREQIEATKRQQARDQSGGGGGGGSILGGLLETLSAPETTAGPPRAEQLKKRAATFQANKALKYAEKIKASNDKLDQRMSDYSAKKALAQKQHKETAKNLLADKTFAPDVTDPRKRREKAFRDAAERTVELKQADKMKSEVESIAKNHADLCNEAPKYQKAVANMDEGGQEKFREALDAAMGPTSAMMKDDVDDTFTERFKKLKEGMEDVHKKMMEALANLASALVPGR